MISAIMYKKLSKWNIPKRYIVVLMVFIGYANIFYLHTNLAMAVVEMTSVKNTTDDIGNVESIAEFQWNSKQKGIVLSTFSYGRLFGPIGGILAGRLGGGTLFGIQILITAAVTLITPYLLYHSFLLFIVTNVILGVFEAFAYASISQLWSRWAPPDERSKFVSFSVIGIYFGNIISFLVSGWILDTWGWPLLFIISGVVTLLWYLIWLSVVANDPAEDKNISNIEVAYIKHTLNSVTTEKKLAYPWKQILTCSPFWAGCLAKFSIGCGYTFTSLYLPQYIKDVNDVDIKKIGYISIIPQICALVSMPLCGCLSDYMRSRQILSVTNVHKLYVSVGLLVGAVVFIVTSQWSSFTASIVCISLFQFFSTFTTVDIQVLVLDLAPKYAAFLNSVTNVFFTGSGIVTPALVGFIVTDHSRVQWNICFITFSAVCLLVSMLFVAFGSGELQSWANYTADDKKIKNKEES